MYSVSFSQTDFLSCSKVITKHHDMSNAINIIIKIKDNNIYNECVWYCNNCCECMFYCSPNSVTYFTVY